MMAYFFTEKSLHLKIKIAGISTFFKLGNFGTK